MRNNISLPSLRQECLSVLKDTTLLIPAESSGHSACSLDLTISALQLIAQTQRLCGDARDRQLADEIEDVCRHVGQAAKLARQGMKMGRKPKA